MIKRCTPILLLICAFAALVGGALLIALQQKRTQDGQALQAAIAGLPTGIMATDAERVLGLPDRVLRAKGVLVNGVMFLAAGNPKASKYGKVERYEQHVWRRGDVTASVFVDGNGRVAGRIATD
jgi:hypothetical protein